MRLLLFVALVLSALRVTLCDNCLMSKTPDLENEVFCFVDDSMITFQSMKNQHVNVFCDVVDTLSCEDILELSAASNVSLAVGSNTSLSEISLKSCPPSLLQCMLELVSASGTPTLYLERQTAALMKEDVAKLGNVTALTMDGADKQTSLPLEAINALPTLTSLHLIEARSVQLPRKGWVSAPPLTVLELTDVELTELPPGGFMGLDKLEKLIIAENNIEKIEDGAFEGLSSLRRLSFRKNKLSSISSGALSSLKELNTLMFTSNELNHLPDGLLTPLSLLQELEFGRNQVELTLGNRAFSNLPSLKTLKLHSNARIRTLPSDLFVGSTNIEQLQLNGNKIEVLSPSLFRGLSSTVRLDLSRNLLHNLTDDVFVSLKSLTYLNLNHNHLKSLPEYLFAGLAALKEAYFDYNDIVHIHSNALLGATNLTTISLAHNKFNFDNKTRSPFDSLKFLKHLNLTGNEISKIEEEIRTTLNRLEILNLSFNYFEEIVFDTNPNASYILSNAILDLRHNQIRRVIVTSRPNIVRNQSTSSRLLLDDNPLVCDCHMYLVRLRTDGLIKTETEPDIDLGNARCSSPENLHNTIITQVDLRDFICNITNEIDSNDNCTVISRASTNEVIINCPILPSKLPHTTSDIILQYFTAEPTINLKLNEQPYSLKDLNIHTLNLSQTNIEYIKFKPNKHLKILDLSYNNIKTVPMEFLDANVELNLENNSLTCDCWHYNIVKTMKESKYVYGATCSDGQTVSNIDLDTLCKSEKAIGIGMATFVSIASVVISAAYWIYKYLQRILVWMITKQIFKPFVKEIIADKDKKYDIFFSYCEEDTQIVEKLVLELEKDFEQKVCVHKRDWPVGDGIPLQIQESVEQSRRTFIYLSEKFLDSTWGNMEFTAAHNLAAQEQRVRVILIIANEKVLTNPKMSKELRAYVENNTYLLHGDPKFYEKLQKVLPKTHYAINWGFLCGRKGDDSDVVEEETVKKHGLNVQYNNEGKLENLVIKDDVERSDNCQGV